MMTTAFSGLVFYWHAPPFYNSNSHSRTPYFALLPIAQAASTPFRLPPRNHPIKMESWTREGVLPDYDLDTDDEEWLDEYNSSRKATRTALLDSDALELAMSFVLGGRGAELDEMVSRRCPPHLIVLHFLCLVYTLHRLFH